MLLRQEHVERHLDDGGIADVAVLVGDGELQGLDHGVDVPGAALPEGGQIDVLEDVEGHQDDDALGDGRLLVDGVAPVVDRERGDLVGLVVGEVFEGEEAAVRALMLSTIWAARSPP